jgi:hypothetical protein
LVLHGGKDAGLDGGVDGGDDHGVFDAFMMVHLPVPFWPAVSRITSMIGLPVSGSFFEDLLVIWMR